MEHLNSLCALRSHLAVTENSINKELSEDTTEYDATEDT